MGEIINELLDMFTKKGTGVYQCLMMAKFITYQQILMVR